LDKELNNEELTFVKIMRKVFGSSPNDKDLEVLLRNPAIAKLYGYSKNSIAKSYRSSEQMKLFLSKELTKNEKNNLRHYLSRKFPTFGDFLLAELTW